MVSMLENIPWEEFCLFGLAQQQTPPPRATMCAVVAKCCFHHSSRRRNTATTMVDCQPCKDYDVQLGRRMRRSRASTSMGAPLVYMDPCTVPTSKASSWNSAAAVWCMLVLWFLPTSFSVPFGTCMSKLSQADADGNQELIQSEYVSFIRALSMSTVSDEFYNYPAELSGAFTQRKSSTDADAGVSIVGSDTTDTTQIQGVQSFCRDVYKGLASALALPLDNTTCIRSYILGDGSRDDSLSEDEYSRFLATLTSNISSSAAYSDLKEPLPAYFEDFASATTGSLNVNGSKPSSTSSVDQSQLDYLTDFCTVSVVGTALSLTGSTTTPASEAPAPAPVPAPTSNSGGTPTTDGGSFVPSFSFYECTSAMAYSDLSRDAVLDESEYVRFLNRLSGGKYESSSGDALAKSELPQALQDNYDTLAAGGSGINVTGGTRPGVPPSDTEEIQLQEICLATDEALQAASGNNPQPSPVTPSGPTTSPPVTAPPGTPAPSAASTPSGLTYALCVRNIMLSDTSRDNALDQTEYVKFLNLGADRAWISLSYEELEPILQQNFDSFAVNGVISVVGYNPNVNATSEQESHLVRFCSQSRTAIESALNGGGTWPPTSAPAPPSTQTIYNAYLTSNTAGLTAKGLRVGPTRQALNDAYNVFVTEQVQIYLTSLTRKLGLRGRVGDSERRLSQASVSLNTASILTYLVGDSPCPATVAGASCQTVYANFSVNVENVPDPKIVVDALTGQLQAAMATDMQRFVTAAVTATPNAVAMQVNGPAAKTTPDETNPPPSPAPAPTPANSGGGGSSPGKTAAAIIGFILLIGLCAGGAIYLHKKGYKVSDFLSWLPPIPGFSGSDKAKKEVDSKNVGGTVDGGSRDGSTHLDDEGGLDNNGFGTFETVTTPDKANFYKNSENGEGSSSVDFMEAEDSESADFSVVEQGTPVGNQTGKSGVFNAFGLGKNKKATGGLDDSYGDLQNPEAINENAAHDFADYSFDDPTADFEHKNGNGSVGDLFEKSDGFASGAKDMAWGGEANEWDGAWGAGNGGEGSAPATRQSGRSSVSGSERSDDDSRSGSESEESESYFERKTSGDRGPTVEAPDNLVHLDSMVEQGNWDEAMAAKAKFEGGFDLDEGSNPSRPSLEESEGLSLSESRSSADDFAEGMNADSGVAGVGDESVQDSHLSLTSEEVRRRDQFRQQVENLVRKIVPDELDNVSAMMDQFSGREAELINTLQNMKERTTTQRARKAIHKSKGIPQRENPAFAAGGADGSAAIAAASTLGVRKDEVEDDGADDQYEEGADEGDYYDDDDARSYDEEYADEYPEGDAEEGSQFSGSEGPSYDEEGSQYSGSQDHDDPDREGSYEDDEERSGSFSGSGSRSRSRSGSYSGSGSLDDQGQEGSYTDDQGESYDDQEGSYYSEEDQERSHSGSYSGSGSYNDDQDPDGSYTDDQGEEGSYNSEDDQERSQDGSYSENGSHDDADQGSYYSEEGTGSQSRRSQDDEDDVDYGYE